MRIYDWNEIKAKADCVQYCISELGMTPQGKSDDWTMFNCPFRGAADSKSFAVKPRGWFDHVTKEKGSILDLAARVKFGGDIWQAQEFLGSFYGIKSRLKAEKARKFVCAYQYCDLDGRLLHETVRYEPKNFIQRRPDPDDPKKYIYNLKDTKTILYRIKDWHKSKWVCLVEGEKDVDNLLIIGVPATTNPMGAEKWRQSYNDFLKGKDVCFLPDNDDVGKIHAEIVATEIKNHVKRIKIVNLPDLQPKGDVSNWLKMGGDKRTLLEIIKNTPFLDIAKLKPLEIPGQDIIAQKANTVDFRNYCWADSAEANKDGQPKQCKQPIGIYDLVENIYERFQGFPKKVGTALFDYNENEGVRWIEGVADLFAWISQKSNKFVKWAKVEGAVSQEQLFWALFHNADAFETISSVPNYPARDDVFYTHEKLPQASPGEKYFNEFCNFFDTATEVDRILLKAFIVSPLYYREKVSRPIWVIDAKHGQSTGKTKLVEMIAFLYGGKDKESHSAFWVDQKKISNELTADRVIKRLLSKSGRKKRIVLIDNVTGYFKASTLSSDATSGEISGMAPYGKGEETRPNDLTFVITVNSASLSRDLIDRSLFINLVKRENRDRNWEPKIQRYIKAHRLQIFADIMNILKAGRRLNRQPFTRYAMWEQEILFTVCGTDAIHAMVEDSIKQQKYVVDAEIEEAELIHNSFWAQLEILDINPETACVWIQSQVIKKWAQESIEGFGGRTGRGAIYGIKNMIKGEMLENLSTELDVYPHQGRGRRRGLMWNHNLRKESDIAILSLNKENEVIIHYVNENAGDLVFGSRI